MTYTQAHTALQTAVAALDAADDRDVVAQYAAAWEILDASRAMQAAAATPTEVAYANFVAYAAYATWENASDAAARQAHKPAIAAALDALDMQRSTLDTQ